MKQRSTTFLLALCMICACDDPKSSLGDLPGTDGSTTHSPTGTADETASAPTESAPNDVGLTCSLSAMPDSRFLDLGNPGCASGMCLYADDIIADQQQTCARDSECRGFGQGIICGSEGLCVLDPVHVAARSICTDFCEQDSDCVGADGTPCTGGFTCLPIAAIGPACCQGVCSCLDDVDVVSGQELAMSCEAGTTPGCCDQEPPGSGCGG